MTDDQRFAQVIARLEHCSRRLRGASFHAERLFKTWSLLNESEALRRRVGNSRAEKAAILIQQTFLREIILTIAKMLDREGQKGVHSDRSSFPVVKTIFAVPGVPEFLMARSDGWVPRRGILPSDDVRACIDGVFKTLDRHEKDPDRRYQLLQSFRHENLAHDLRVVAPTKLIFGYIPELLADVTEMAKQVSWAVEGLSHDVDHEAYVKSMGYLWDAASRMSAVEAEREQRSWFTRRPREGRCFATFKRRKKHAVKAIENHLYSVTLFVAVHDFCVVPLLSNSTRAAAYSIHCRVKRTNCPI